MTLTRSAAAALAAVGLLITGCGGEPAARQVAQPASSTAAAEPTATAASPSPLAEAPTVRPPATPTRAPAAPGTTITTGKSDFGEMLFDAKKQAIYLFDTEKTSRAECYDACAEAWPPVLTTGAPQADGAAQAGLLGTTKRTDGTTQVTYAGHPLYYYAHERPGQVLCHNVDEFGGLWLVVTPGGDPAA